MATPGSRRVDVVDYDPRWISEFEWARDTIAAAMPTARSIEHIGSTSVPGLRAKPIVDVLAVVDDLDVLDAALEPLADAGFVLRPDAFPDRPDHQFLRRMVDDVRTHHLHVLRSGSTEIEDYRAFRDLLTHDAEARHRYEALKVKLAARHRHDILAYIDGKHALVEELLVEARGRTAADDQAPSQPGISTSIPNTR